MSDYDCVVWSCEIVVSLCLVERQMDVITLYSTLEYEADEELLLLASYFRD